MQDKTLAAIMAHAKQAYPLECCGIVAQKSRVERYFPCRNILPSNEKKKKAPNTDSFWRRRTTPRPKIGEQLPLLCIAILTPPRKHRNATKIYVMKQICHGL